MGAMFSVVGISHRTAPVAVRELASVRAAEASARLNLIRGEFPDAECVLLSTCNRAEIYASGLDAARHKDRLMRALLNPARDHAGDMASFFYDRHGRDAVRHLFAVASSLDSMVVGETEILGQVKEALALAEKSGAAGDAMTALFRGAIRTARRVHAQTDIGRGRVSVSSLAVEFAVKVLGDLQGMVAMIIGAGDTAELALKSLVNRGIDDVLVLNRSHHHGEDLARRCGGRACDFGLLDDCLSRADVVISSTRAPHVVVRADAVRRAMAGRAGRPLLLIDIAVPRDVDPEANSIDGVHVCTIDDLQRVADENLARRQDAVGQAWQVVDEELKGFGAAEGAA